MEPKPNKKAHPANWVGLQRVHFSSRLSGNNRLFDRDGQPVLTVTHRIEGHAVDVVRNRRDAAIGETAWMAVVCAEPKW